MLSEKPPGAETVILTVPGATPLTRPVESTVATALLLLDQERAAVAVLGEMMAFRSTVPPGSR